MGRDLNTQSNFKSHMGIYFIRLFTNIIFRQVQTEVLNTERERSSQKPWITKQRSQCQCGRPLQTVLVRKVPEALKTKQPIALILDYPAELEGKGLLLKTAYIQVTEIKLELSQKLPLCCLAFVEPEVLCRLLVDKSHLQSQPALNSSRYNND